MTFASSRSRLLSVAAFLLLASPALPARAALVTYNFTGTVTTLNDPTGILGGQVHIGDSYGGSLVYDTSAAGTILAATREIYTYQPAYAKNYVAPVGISNQVGAFGIKPDYFYDDMTVQVFNNAPTSLGGVADGLIATQDYNGPAGFFRSDVELDDTTAAVFSSLALPSSLNTSSFNLGSFAYSQSVLIGNVNTMTTLFSGTINGLAIPAAVPEPASLLLLAGGLIGVGAWCRASTRRRTA